MKTKLLLFLLLNSLTAFSQINLVANGGFESWSSANKLNNWTTENSVLQNSNSIEGTSCAKLQLSNSSSNPKIIAQIPLNADVTYTVKYKYKYVSSNYSGDHPITLKISKTGSSNTITNSSYGLNNEWVERETTFTADQTLSFDLSISLFSFDNAPFEVYIDDVQVYIQGTEKYTLIPDVNFEKKLISLKLDFGNTDGKVLTNNIDKVTSLNVSNNSIANLTGIQDFTALTTLNVGTNSLSTLDVSKNLMLNTLSCNNNILTSLDLSKNTNLTSLNAYTNKLTSLNILGCTALKTLSCTRNELLDLDISSNTALESMDCNNNKISSLDFSKNTLLNSIMCDTNNLTTLDLAANTKLTSLSFNSNQLTSLDLSNNPGLTKIYVTDNLLTNLNVSNCTSLKTLWCQRNQLGLLDLSKISTLEELICGKNQIAQLDIAKNMGLKSFDFAYNLFTTIDVTPFLNLTILSFESNQIKTLNVSNNVALQNLNFFGNQVTTLDVSKNTKLVQLNCRNNKLTYLNLKNGNNLNLDTYITNTDFKGNNDLTCIQVDDVAFSNSKWPALKDANVLFSTSCTLGIEESIFDKVVLYPNPTKGEVNIENVSLEKVTVYNTLGQLVKTFALNSGNTNNNISLTGLPKGVYYVYLINHETASVKKVIVE